MSPGRGWPGMPQVCQLGVAKAKFILCFNKYNNKHSGYSIMECPRPETSTMPKCIKLSRPFPVSYLKHVGSLLTAAALTLSVASAQATDWDMPTPYGDSNFHTVNIRQFADDVREATGGELNITVHSSGSLIKHPEIKNSVRRGLVPIGELIMSRLANEDPLFEIDSVPYLASDYDQAWT